jgi:hypothetical protein
MGSHYQASVMTDEDSVKQLLNRVDGDKSPPMSYVGWTPERDLLTTIADILNGIHATLVQVNDERGNRPDIDPLPRPTTVIDRVERIQTIELYDSIVSQFLPGKARE